MNKQQTHETHVQRVDSTLTAFTVFCHDFTL